MQETLFDSRLADRDFGSHVLHIPALLDWVKAKGLHLPVTLPALDGYKFVQVEALLAAISRPYMEMNPEQALNLVMGNPELKGHEAVSEGDALPARWLLGADAHMKWEKRIAAAVQSGELVLLDFASKLPIAADSRADRTYAAKSIAIPAKRTHVDADAIPGWIADVLVPIPPAVDATLTGLIKLVETDRKGVHTGEQLTDEDWAFLDRIWSHLPRLSGSITAEQYKPYRLAFDRAVSGPDVPRAGPRVRELHATFKDTHGEAQIRWMNVRNRHWYALADAARRGEIAILDGTTHLPTNRIERGAIVSVAHLRAYLAGCGIELREGAQDAPAMPQTAVTPEQSDTASQVSIEQSEATAEAHQPPIKRCKLISDLTNDWPTIDNDLREASRNGLDAARVATKKGYWDSGKALAWATQNHKLKSPSRNTMENVPSRKITTK